MGFWFRRAEPKQDADPKGVLSPIAFLIICLIVSGISDYLQGDVILEVVDHRAANEAIAVDDESAFTDAQGYLLSTPDAISAFRAWNRKFYSDDPDMRDCLNGQFTVIGGVTLAQAEAFCSNSLTDAPAQHLAARQ